MNLQRLRAFNAVMKTGSVTAAAEALLLTQPAVSKLLRALEAEVGFALFLRLKGRMVPSPQGRAFHQRCERLLAEIEDLSTVARNVAENRVGELRLVSMLQLSITVLPSALCLFQARYPDVFVSLEVIPRRDADRWIAGVAFDLGVTALPMEWPGLIYEPFMAMDPVAVVPQAHPLAGRAEIDASDLHGQDFIRLTHPNLLRSHVDRALVETNAHPAVRAEVSSPVTACALAAQGIGIAVVDAHSPRAVPLEGLRVVRWRAPITLTYGFFQPLEGSNPFVKPFKEMFKAAIGGA